MEKIGKKKVEHGLTTRVSAKRPEGLDSRSRGQQGPGRCGKCDKAHEGVYRVRGSGCYKCGKTGHYGRDLYCPYYHPGIRYDLLLLES